MIELAKPAVDVGLFTNRHDDMLAFWQHTAGVPFAELLPLGGGLRQHRHAIGDTVLKINHSREPLPEAPAAGIRRLVIARPDITEDRVLEDPDGNRLLLTPSGGAGPRVRVEVTVTDLSAHQHFYGVVLGLPAAGPTTFRCGASLIEIRQGEAVTNPPQLAGGYRYLTLQVFDVRACHAEILRLGGQEGRPPAKVGDVAHISFVRDPDGNWIEISQRKSITGSLD